MRPSEKFTNLPMEFWANVRLLSETLGYKIRGKDEILIPRQNDYKKAYSKLNLTNHHVISDTYDLTNLGEMLTEYFEFRADALIKYIEPSLMDKNRACSIFNSIQKDYIGNVPIPMNKQAKDKKKPAYFTSIINMLIDLNKGKYSCDFNPQNLTKFIREKKPLRTFSRRIDGAFPGVINPIAIWEIKEYYYATTFGSRVADGVYETLVDGMELNEIKYNEKVIVKHYMMVDGYETWWGKGISYLCRLIDMMHIGYVDEVLFGIEVIDRIPKLVKEWIKVYENNTIEGNNTKYG